MKKFFLAFMAVATIAMVGCKKNNDPVPTPTPTPTPGQDTGVVVDIPEIDAPEAGYVTFVISIPKGTECNGIAFKGTVDGAAWTGANQYLGEEGPADVDNCIVFEEIEGFDGQMTNVKESAEDGVTTISFDWNGNHYEYRYDQEKKEIIE